MNGSLDICNCRNLYVHPRRQPKIPFFPRGQSASCRPKGGDQRRKCSSSKREVFHTRHRTYGAQAIRITDARFMRTNRRVEGISLRVVDTYHRNELRPVLQISDIHSCSNFYDALGVSNVPTMTVPWFLSTVSRKTSFGTPYVAS